MAKIRNHRHVVQRWDWTSFGYEKDFPRKCEFSDIDAIVEFDGLALVIEAKNWDGVEELPETETGQKLLGKFLTRRGIRVWFLYGDARVNNPLMMSCPKTGEQYDWRHLPLEDRRAALKRLIDKLMRVKTTHTSPQIPF